MTLQEFLAGRNPYGSAGFDIANALGQTRSGSLDPRLYQYGLINNSESGGSYGVSGPDLNYQGEVMIDGQPWVQASSARGFRSEDPSQFRYDERYGALTPATNPIVDEGNFFDQWGGMLMAGLPMLGSVAAHAGLFGGAASGGAEAGTGAFDVGGSSGFGGSTPTASLPDSYWSAVADSGGVASDASSGGWNGLFGETGGLDPETLAGHGGMGVSQNGIGPGSWMNQLTGAINNPSSLANSQGLLGRGASAIGGAITNNPMGAARAALGIGSMLGGGQRPTSGGMPTPVTSTQGNAPKFEPWQGQFQMNPYLMQQVPFMGLFGG